MKIRIKGNSIRYRLTRSEVEGLGADSPLSETVDFGNTQLVYRVSCAEGEKLVMSFDGHIINLDFPLSLLSEWQSTEKVGYSGQSGRLNVLIEKDFTCLDNVDEDQSDNYPNPLLKGAQ